jgi:hypothetical protein
MKERKNKGNMCGTLLRGMLVTGKVLGKEKRERRENLVKRLIISVKTAIIRGSCCSPFLEVSLPIFSTLYCIF